MNFLEDERGFGVEDTPFMLVMTVIVLLVTVSIAVSVMMMFVEGNKYQKAADAGIEIYKYARIATLGDVGSKQSFNVEVPNDYYIVINGGVEVLHEQKKTYENGTGYFENQTVGERMSLESKDITGPTLYPGDYRLVLNYTNTDTIEVESKTI